MDTSVTKYLNSDKLNMFAANSLQKTLYVIAGVCLGIAVLISTSVPLRWGASIIVGLLVIACALMFISRFEKIAYGCFVFLLPIQLGKSFFNHPLDVGGGAYDLRINLPEIFFAILFVGFFARNIRTGLFSGINGKIVFAAMAFLTWSAVSLTQAPDFLLGLFELVRAITVFLMFVYVAHYIDDRSKLSKTILFLILAMAVQTFVGLCQWGLNKEIGLPLFGEMEMNRQTWAEEAITRVGGLLGHPNAFASYLVITIPLCFALYRKNERLFLKIARLSMFAAGIVALIGSQSRGAWVAFGVSLTVGLLFFFAKKNIFGKEKWAIGILIIVSFLLVILLCYGTINRRMMLDDRGSVASRIPMMIDSLKVIEENPLLGVGMNNYALAVPKYDITGIHREWVATTVHNLFLLVTAESGIFAGLAFLSFWILLLIQAWRLIRLRDSAYVSLGIVLFMSVTAFIVVHQVDPAYRFYPAIQRQIWVIAGIVTAAVRLIDRKHAEGLVK